MRQGVADLAEQITAPSSGFRYRICASIIGFPGYLCTTTLHAFRHDLPLAVTTPEPPLSDGRLSARFDAMAPKV
jgi:hypothetical protein